MTREAVRVDIATQPDLEQLADEVVRTRTPRVITRDDEDLVILSPAGPKRRRLPGKQASQADIDAALATFGTWKDLDAEKFLRELDEARSDDSPPVKL